MKLLKFCMRNYYFKFIEYIRFIKMGFIALRWHKQITQKRVAFFIIAFWIAIIFPGYVQSDFLWNGQVFTKQKVCSVVPRISISENNINRFFMNGFILIGSQLKRDFMQNSNFINKCLSKVGSSLIKFITPVSAFAEDVGKPGTEESSCETKEESGNETFEFHLFSLLIGYAVGVSLVCGGTYIYYRYT